MPTDKLLLNDTGNLPEGLRARLADPFWTLHRQWSLMEFHAEDSGTPVEASVTLETRPLPSSPLEAQIEAEPVANTRLRFRIAAEAGHALVLWMRSVGRTDIETTRSAYPLAAPPELQGRERVRARLWETTSLDALDLANDLSADPTLRSQVLAWLAVSHYENHLSNWAPRAMAYSGQVGSPGMMLSYAGYTGGNLDWTAWTLVDETGTGTETITLPTPSRVSIPGLPDRRWWSIEDSNMDLSDPSVEGWRTPQMVAAEFAVAHNDDWFSVPVKVPRGVAVRVNNAVVTDSFGVQIQVPSARTVDATRPHQTFGLWEITNGGDWLIILPPMSDPLQGPVLERVRFFENEDANMGWAVEEVASLATGAIVKRSTVEYPPPDEPGYAWLLASRVPEHWYPLVAKNVDGVQVDLMQGRMGNQVAPMGQILKEMPALPEEQVRGPGFVVERRWQRARLADGGVITWLGRERRSATPTNRRDVAWDRVIGSVTNA